MTPFYRETPPLDPELAAMSADYWFDHAEADLEAQEQRTALFALEDIRTGEIH